MFSRVSVYTVGIIAIYSAVIIQLWEIKCKSMRDGGAYILLHFCLSLKRDGDFSLVLDAEKQTGLSFI